jgi:hypothetical protein
MRQTIRIQPYLTGNLFQKLRAYAAAQSLTVSAVVSAALGEYLEGNNVEDALILRRLDNVAQAVEQLRRDLDALGIGFGRFVRYSLLTAPAIPDEQTVKRGEVLFRTFLARVGEQYRAGVNFTRQVFPPRRSVSAAPGPVDREEDGRKGEGQP